MDKNRNSSEFENKTYSKVKKKRKKRRYQQ